jgi:SAM-dependent methyltransferase
MSFYAESRTVPNIDDCHFYHTMDVPGVGLVSGEWDLRANVDDILGRVPFDGTRVLEIGPASGFLTFAMEQRGADVVCMEVTDDPGWDFVPYPAAMLDPVLAPRREIMRRLKNSFWFAHAAYHSKAKLLYGDVYNIPAELGSFDIAMLCDVLLHCQNPTRIIEQCATRSRTIVVSELLRPDLEGAAVCRLAPSVENKQWDTWWHFSTDFSGSISASWGFQNSKR